MLLHRNSRVFKAFADMGTQAGGGGQGERVLFKISS